MNSIRAFIVDDEPPARTRVRELLALESDIKIAGEFASGSKAIQAINADPPDLLFLDVQMPEIDGFGVLAALSDDKIPVTIFVTAYDKYALKAFDAHAFDYLLKPFSDERFAVALDRARLVLNTEDHASVRKAISSLLADRKSLDRLAIKTVDRTYLLKVEEIAWIEAAGAYVRLHTKGGTHLLRTAIGSLGDRLDGDQFIRIHRSTIVNIDRIAELQPYFHGEFVVVLEDGTELKLSRTYRPRLQDRLNQTI